MGRDLTILSKHDIDFYNTKTLMKRLSVLHKANVTLGFHSYIDLSEHYEALDFGNIEDDSTGSYEIESLIIDEKLPSVIIIIENFLYKWLLKTYGNKAGSLPAFKQHWTEDKTENLDIIESFAKEDDCYHIMLEQASYQIYKDHLNLSWLNTMYRWWGFYRYTLNETHSIEDKPDDFLMEINNIRATAQYFGSDGAWYLDDQSSSLKGIGQGEELGLKWEEIESEIKRLVGVDKIIDFRKCISNNAYREEVNAKIGERAKQYSAFYDDFSN